MRKLLRLFFVLTVILTALSLMTPAWAAQAGKVLKPADLERFIDGYLAERMAADSIPGAMVSVVQDGKVVFMKGYGFADRDGRIAVDPGKTLFRIGSMSKIFTWTAVMQLVEAGKLNLNADINTYLDFKIPATYRQPITLNNLMAHNAGFEIDNYDQMAVVPEAVIPNAAWLKTHIPARVRPPGQVSGYGNYSAALAGYIVERVSGMSYDDYIDKNILGPLGMAHTSSRQPLPASLRSDLAKGYLMVNGQIQPGPAEFLNDGPAGSFCSSAADISRFMIACLQDGRLGDAQIMRPETIRLMQSRSYSHDPRLNGWAHGFMEQDLNGQRIIGHPGMTMLFRSVMILFPQHNLGVFVSVNGTGGDKIVFGFPHQFVKEFFPKQLPLVRSKPGFARRAGRFCGSYRMTQAMSYTTPEKLLALVQSFNLEADQGGLVVNNPFFGLEHYIESEPLVFRNAETGELLIFREDNRGNIREGFYGPNPMLALEKNAWYETPMFNLILLGLCIIIFLSFIMGTPIAALIRRRRTPTGPTDLPIRLIRPFAGLVCFLNLLFLLGVFVSIFNFVGLYYGHVPLWKYIPAVSYIVVLMNLGMADLAILAWKRRLWSRVGRIHYTLVAVSGIAFIWFIVFWNLLGKDLVAAVR